ncbi:uncharacterized protein LAESUDRAFT_755515 [Laetiporus sulphureus 93-53]|uniref:Uncharacterized protein n=1 Tax=Laetiporus sulphureus 93-53 TaxID=1314785 RepID=A0A165GV73_9APHY|nr:uncharacterized protein LAESUDRAFT_755515 [Laetiporus sulphureus 93-53]KZT10862.1 hypothetical protein LAESUDRAFT_755515 [Laetiporus sulphureus 93-53]
MKAVASVCKATSRFATKCKTSRRRRAQYDSLLFEGDSFKNRAISEIECRRDKLKPSAFNQWNTVLDVLNAERRKLTDFSSYKADFAAEKKALSDAQKYRLDAEDFYNRSQNIVATGSPQSPSVLLSGHSTVENPQRELVLRTLRAGVPSATDPGTGASPALSDEQQRSKSAPSPASAVSFNKKDTQPRSISASTGGQPSRRPTLFTENALGLIFSRRRDSNARSPTSSTDRSMSLRSVFSSIMMAALPSRTTLPASIAEDTSDAAVERPEQQPLWPDRSQFIVEASFSLFTGIASQYDHTS